jgi:putative ABC transport system permease protein
MNILWDKVWFDLWHHKTRTLLAIVSIAAGVFAIGAIFGLVNQLLSGMDVAHRASQPAHLLMTLRQPIDQAMVDGIKKLPGIAGVEPLNTLTTRYKSTSHGEWRSAIVNMRQDFVEQQYDRYTLQQGEWPHDRAIGVERLSSDFYGIQPGDQIIFDMPGADRTFQVTGKIRHPLVLPPNFGGSAYFFINAEGLTRLGVPRDRYWSLMVQVTPWSDDYAKDRASAIKERLGKQGVGVAIIMYKKPHEHWGRNLVAGINFVLRILAVAALLASVILVTNTMTALITQQTDQIGVIKAIGGRTTTIIQLYLAGALVYGALALLIALPLGMVTAYRGAQALLMLFNIDYKPFQFSTQAVILQVLAAIGAPLLAALWPVLQGAAISVREAIASYGLGGDFGSGWLDRMIERLGNRLLPATDTLALGNLFRKRRRLILTQGVLIVAGSMFLLVMTLSASVTLTVDNELNRRGYDVRIRFPAAERTPQMLALVRATPGVAYLESWFSLIATVLRNGERVRDTGGLGVEVVGIPTSSAMYRPYVIAGRWLAPEERARVVVLEQGTAELNQITVGEWITIDFGDLGHGEWQVVGIYTAITPDAVTTDLAYVPAAALRQVTKKSNWATQIVVTAQDPSYAATVALLEELKQRLDERGMKVDLFVSRTKLQDRVYAFNQYNIVIGMLLGLAVVMALVGGFALASSLSISVLERTREIGVLRAIGARTPTLMRMFVLEALLQGCLSWLIATPLALLMASPVASRLGQIMLDADLDYTFNTSAVFVWLGMVLTISLLASILPAYNAARISVRQSLSYA